MKVWDIGLLKLYKLPTQPFHSKCCHVHVFLWWSFVFFLLFFFSNTLKLLKDSLSFHKWKGLLLFLLISNTFHIKSGHLRTRHTESVRMWMCSYCKSVVLHKYHLMIHWKLSLDKPSMTYVFKLLYRIFPHQ